MGWSPGNQKGVMLRGGRNDQLVKCYRQIKLVRTELVIRFGHMASLTTRVVSVEWWGKSMIHGKSRTYLSQDL